MNEAILQVEQLNKSYGRVKALQSVNFEVKQGQVFGILGPNGSGKTTTLGILLGVLQQYEGSFRWFGREAGHEQRARIGAMLETPNFYNDMSGWQNLKLVAGIKGESEQEIQRVLEQVGLLSRAKDKFSQYSLGMKQRLAVASALMGDPSVLVLDEPTNGLDPQGIAEMRNLIIELGQQGKTIILASHLLDEVERVCTHLAVLKQGQLLYTGAANFQQERKVLVACDDNNLLATLLRQRYNDIQVQATGDKLSIAMPGVSAKSINRFAHEQSLTLHHIEVLEANLEDEFLKLIA